MIEINLLPEELKVKEQKKNFDPKHLLYLLPLVLGILLILHFYLGSISLMKMGELASLNGKWQSLQPQVKTIDSFRKEQNVYTADANLSQQLGAQRINWARKLNKLSLSLPYGIWFSNISITPGDFALKCSVVSLQKEEMGLINKFMSNLKQDKDFIKEFNTLELSSVQKKQIGIYDVVDFVLSGTLIIAEKKQAVPTVKK